MSMDSCKDCGLLVDTDMDVECYYQQYPDNTEVELDACRCEDCRARIYDIVEQQGYKPH